MRAIVRRRYGGPEQLRIEDVPVPSPGPGQVRVAVRAASVNAKDWRELRADPFFLRFFGTGVFRPRFPVLGSDLAGVVDAVGAGVTRLREGDEVFGEVPHGAFAEFAVAREDVVVAKPAELSFAAAAALPMAGLTALQGLRDVAKVRSGTRVLINGASGGVGSYAIQIARSLGAHVTGVCSTAKVDLVRSLGADAVIDYTAEDFVARDETWDVVFDLALNRSTRKVEPALAPDGLHVVVGGTGHRLLQSMLHKAVGARVAVVMAEPKVDDLELLGRMAAEGTIVPSIERTVPFVEGIDAIRWIDAGQVRGKVVMSVG